MWFLIFLWPVHDHECLLRLLHRNWDWRSLEAVIDSSTLVESVSSSELKLHAQAWGRWSALGCNGLNHLPRNPEELSSWMCYVYVSVGVKLSLKERWWNSGKRNSSSEPRAELVVTWIKGLLKQNIRKNHWYDETGKQIGSVETPQNYNIDCQT